MPTGFSSRKLFERKKGLLICSLNAPSLLKHKDEAKIDETISSCHNEINDYNHERFDRNRHGGGVCTINYERLNDFSPSDNEALETVTAEIKPRCANSFIVIAWYRPPKSHFTCIDNIKSMYRFYDSSSKEIIILGDTNCDDLPDEDKNTVVKNLRAFYGEYQIKQLIRKSTRVTNRSDTLIDHFATNTPKFIIKSGVKTIGFSHHDLIYVPYAQNNNREKKRAQAYKIPKLKAL